MVKVLLDTFSRTELLIGNEGRNRLAQSKVAVFGVGGVGSFTVEALARAGVGSLTLIDFDTINETNLNRQIHAFRSTIGRPKVEVLRERILDINCQIQVRVYQEFIQEENVDRLIDNNYDYLVDAIDTVTGKLLLIERALKVGVPIVSSMGAGNRLDPTQFIIDDISKTSGCPLARIMRRELKKRGIERGLKVVYSTAPLVPVFVPKDNSKINIGSISYVPPVAGLYLAYQVINDLLVKNKKD